MKGCPDCRRRESRVNWITTGIYAVLSLLVGIATGYDCKHPALVGLTMGLCFISGFMVAVILSEMDKR